MACALVVLDTIDIDRIVAHWFFDPATASFPLRHAFFLDTVMHHGAKVPVALVTCLVIAGFLLSYVVTALEPLRRILLYLGLALAIAPATVSVLKTTSARHCPWDLEEFGGLVPYARLLDPAPPSIRPGRCFPAGHASTGFTLMAFYFAGRALQRRFLSRAGLAAGLLLGVALGTGRMIQGAHFLSHTLWSGLVCWIVALCLYWLVLTPLHEGRIRAA